VSLIGLACLLSLDGSCKSLEKKGGFNFFWCIRCHILWYSKWQNRVETFTFGSEFCCAMKMAINMIEGLPCYMLRMMGIPLIGSTSVFCDNESVIKNLIAPESQLKKRHNVIAYHHAREAQAAKIIPIAWESRDTRIADLLTKLMPGPKLKELVSYVFW
jgi:hypothetical protein